MKTAFLKVLKKALPALLCMLMLALLIYSIVLRTNASSIGASVGSSAGVVAGRAVGSLKGLTVGRAEGAAAGKEAGLSAVDTEAVIANQLHQVNNLEVLIANVRLANFHEVGDKDSNRDYYAALYLVNGTVVFTVDLSKAQINLQDDGLHISLPKPVGTLYLDDSSVEKAAEYQTKLFNGTMEDGYKAYLNSFKELRTISEETLVNYQALIASAEEAAKDQVSILAQSTSVGDNNIIVEWID